MRFHRLSRFILFIICWLALSGVIFILTIPDKRPPKDFFMMACATKLIPDDKPHFAKAGEMAYYSLDEINQNPANFKLCTAPVERYFASEWHTMALTPQKDGYYLQIWTDSMGDPLEYWYRIDDGKAVAVAWRTGLTMAKITAGFLGLMFAILPYRGILWLWRKRRPN